MQNQRNTKECENGITSVYSCFMIKMKILEIVKWIGCKCFTPKELTLGPGAQYFW